jgi:hypothetical protein
MPIYPWEQKVIKSNVLKKGKVVSKYAILQRMSLKTTEDSLETWFLPLCNMQFNISKEKSSGDLVLMAQNKTLCDVSISKVFFSWKLSAIGTQ